MNFAIIGCGVIARTHAEALAKLPGETLYAVCDIIAEKARDFAAEHGVKEVYDDHRVLLENPEIDIVCVCVPSGIHGDICIDAARAGKAIVCEKPMEITPQRMREVIQVVEEAGVKMQCIFQRRLMPVAIALRELVRGGALGRICFAEASLLYYRDQAYYDSAGWRGTWALDGGGSLMNQGVHGVDLILWMLGDKVQKLTGSAQTLARKIEVEDTAAAVLSMASGALCVIKSATTAYPGYSTEFAIYGEKGAVSFNDEQVLFWNFIDAENAPKMPGADGEAVGGAQNPTMIGNLGHVRLLEDIAGAVREDRAPMIPPREALQAVDVICAIYESSSRQTEIHFDR